MKIKIDKKVWVIVGIVIFAIALVSLVRIYLQQVNEQDQLRTSLAAQQALLRRLTTDKEDLEDRLTQAESLLNLSQAKFPQSAESIEYGEDLFAIAEDYDLELTDFRPSKPLDKKAGAVTYSVSSFAIKVSGSVDNILDFIQALRTGNGFTLPWSAEVKAVTIDIANSEATVTLDIYAYKR